jgi:AAA15 family ATPase/GTPase
MVSLYIENFLTIKKAEIEFKKITVIIGHQATGKSIVSKLKELFDGFLSEGLAFIIYLKADKRGIDKNILETFISIFPRYSWQSQNFSITYQFNSEISIKISQGINGRGKLTPKVTYSPGLSKLIKEGKKFAINIENSEKEAIPSVQLRPVKIRFYVGERVFGKKFLTPFFIPAGRSFFAIVQKNIFGLLSEQIDIDPFIQKFGALYERYKSTYFNLRSDFQMEKHEERDKKILAEIERLIDKILVGKYRYYDREDWIEGDRGQRINLANASSGQQEALPMLLIASTMPFVGRGQLSSFTIEEPEAHLYPVAQKHIIELFALLYNQKDSRFLLTTHSPYILTALNVLIKAGNLSSQTDNEQLLAKIDRVVPRHFHIKYEDVAAYTIEDGEIKSILNQEYQIIGSSIIDEVSDELDYVYNSLLELEDEL